MFNEGNQCFSKVDKQANAATRLMMGHDSEIQFGKRDLLSPQVLPHCANISKTNEVNGAFITLYSAEKEIHYEKKAESKLMAITDNG